MVDIARSPEVKRKKKIRRIIYAVIGLIAIVGITIGVSRLRPAAPLVDGGAAWRGKAERGPMVRQVRGSGTLIPEQIRWITSRTSGRIERFALRPGAPVTPDTVILEMSNPDLEQQVRDAKLAWQSAQAAAANRGAELESQFLSQESEVAQTKADYDQAVLTLAANEDLYKEKLISELQVKGYRADAEGLKNRLRVAEKRLTITKEGLTSQLAPQEAEVNQRKSAYELRVRELDDLKVKAGMNGVLQVLPVEIGQQVAAGVNVARVADPTVLKAELRIAETQTRDIAIGLPAEVDTRNGIVVGKVSRIDPSSTNGTVGVDIQLEGALPAGSRPDLSVDGTVQLERLPDVIKIPRPSMGQENAAIQLFKLQPDGEWVRTKVVLGRSSVNEIEVKEGLQPGDQVILSDMSNYDEFDRVRVSG